MVSIVLGFDTALAYWSNPRARTLPLALDAHQAAEALDSAQGRVHTSLLSSIQKMHQFASLPAPYNILVRSDNERRQTRRALFRCVNGFIPDGALAELSGLRLYSGGELYRILMSTPEFCFVQMARYLNEVELIELGFELCGAYTIYPAGRNGLGKRPPLTTPEQLAAFANSCTGVRCVNRARSAAKYVLANARSPKEAQLTILATLPRKKGGFALPRPLLNNVLHVDSRVARVLESPTIIPDLHWPDISTVIEYDSDIDHAGESTRLADARKGNAYDMLGIRHISLTYDQFKDLSTMSGIFEDIASRFGIKHRVLDMNQALKREELHRRLLYASRRPRVFVGPEESASGLYEAPNVVTAANLFPKA